MRLLNNPISAVNICDYYIFVFTTYFYQLRRFSGFSGTQAAKIVVADWLPQLFNSAAHQIRVSSPQF